MKKRHNEGGELIPVEKPKFGELYHVAWGYSKGVVGRCIQINESDKTVILRTTKTKKQFKYPVKFSDLRHTRKNQFKIKNQQP